MQKAHFEEKKVFFFIAAEYQRNIIKSRIFAVCRETRRCSVLTITLIQNVLCVVITSNVIGSL